MRRYLISGHENVGETCFHNNRVESDRVMAKSEDTNGDMSDSDGVAYK